MRVRSHTRNLKVATYGDCVDRIGVAVVVAVVVVLAPIATGYHKDAPKALAAGDHPMLQGSLRRKTPRDQLRNSQKDLYLPRQSPGSCFKLSNCLMDALCLSEGWGQKWEAKHKIKWK